MNTFLFQSLIHHIVLELYLNLSAKNILELNSILLIQIVWEANFPLL